MVNIPFVFGMGVFLRIFVPGLAAGLVAAAFLGRIDWFRGLEGVTLFLLLSGLLGLTLRVLSPFVGELLIGTYWLSGIRIGRMKSLEKRLRDAEETLKRPPAEFNSSEGWRYAQAGRYVLLFPIDQFGKRSVAAPTLAGNIIASWLSYLALQHGLQYLGTRAFERHMLFILTRIWFALPREIRQEVSDGLAESEALIGSVTAFVLGGFAFLGKGLYLALTMSWPSAVPPFGLTVAAFALAWFLYKAFLRQTVTAGVVYEALFGNISRSEVERIIEEASKALAAQTGTKSEEGQNSSR